MSGPAQQERSSSSPRRRPAAGGYARGEEKRLRIIEAALRRFGEDGYDGASTREIAQEAGVNPPALQYYFDSKEGLYAACLRHITDRFSAAMQDSYRRAEAVGPGRQEEARTVFCDLLDRLADFLFDTVDVEGRRRFVTRIKARDGHGPLDTLRKEAADAELFRHCFRLVGLVIGQPPDSDETRLRMLVAMGALTAFHMERDNMLARLDWPDLSGPRLARLKMLLRRQAMAALSG